MQLAAGVSAANASARAWTTLEQRRSGGGDGCVARPATPPVRAAAGARTSLDAGAAPLPAGFDAPLPDAVWWVWEGGVGYLLLDRLPGVGA